MTIEATTNKTRMQKNTTNVGEGTRCAHTLPYNGTQEFMMACMVEGKIVMAEVENQEIFDTTRRPHTCVPSDGRCVYSTISEAAQVCGLGWSAVIGVQTRKCPRLRRCAAWGGLRTNNEMSEAAQVRGLGWSAHKQ